MRFPLLGPDLPEGRESNKKVHEEREVGDLAELVEDRTFSLTVGIDMLFHLVHGIIPIEALTHAEIENERMPEA